LQQRLGLGGTVGGGHAIALVFEAVTEGTQDGGLIIHQQNAALVPWLIPFSALLNE
jgi:hypothetical protein